MKATDNVNDYQLEETSSYTRPVKHSFSHRWTIEDFSVMLADTSSEYPVFSSAPFSLPVNSAIQFTIDLYPKGDEEEFKDYLAIYLASQESNVLAGYSISFIDSKGVKCKEAMVEKPKMFNVENNGDCWGWNKFVLRSDLLDPANDLLNKDRLMIYCEVTVFGAFTINSAKYIPSLEEVKVLSKKQILVDLNCALECGKQTDFTVVVGNGANSKEIRAHKFVLVGGSPVFEAMFKYNTSEKQSGVVTLPDVFVEVGELFIRYLYTGKVNQLETYAEELFVVADKYDIDLLKRMCVQCLCSQMSPSSVWQLLLLSDRHSSAELQQSCIEYITNHANEVIRNDEWQMISQLNDQLKMDLFRKLANKHSIEK